MYSMVRTIVCILARLDLHTYMAHMYVMYIHHLQTYSRNYNNVCVVNVCSYLAFQHVSQYIW